MKASVFIGVSVDGFIARANGDLDWLPAGGGEERLIITRVPVLIGSGIPLFGVTPLDIPLQHIATRQYASGLVQSEYAVAGAPHEEVPQT
jgi:dihydrofolate reductase